MFVFQLITSNQCQIILSLLCHNLQDKYALENDETEKKKKKPPVETSVTRKEGIEVPLFKAI